MSSQQLSKATTVRKVPPTKSEKPPRKKQRIPQVSKAWGELDLDSKATKVRKVPSTKSDKPPRKKQRIHQVSKAWDELDLDADCDTQSPTQSVKQTESDEQSLTLANTHENVEQYIYKVMGATNRQLNKKNPTNGAYFFTNFAPVIKLTIKTKS